MTVADTKTTAADWWFMVLGKEKKKRRKRDNLESRGNKTVADPRLGARVSAKERRRGGEEREAV